MDDGVSGTAGIVVSATGGTSANVGVDASGDARDLDFPSRMTLLFGCFRASCVCGSLPLLL